MEHRTSAYMYPNLILLIVGVDFCYIRALYTECKLYCFHSVQFYNVSAVWRLFSYPLLFA